MINYFNPLKEQSILEKQKSIALKWIMLSLFFLLGVLIINSLNTGTFTSISDYFLPVGQVFVICVLLVLRKYGLQKAGNFFSYGAILFMAIVINIFDDDSIYTKYAEEFYLALFVLVFMSLFASRKALLIAAIVFFISSMRVYFHFQQSPLDQTNILNEIHFFFSFTLVNISLILYFAAQFSDKAIDTAKKDAKIKEEQNIALEIGRKRAEESELLYRNIFNNLVGGFYKTDVNGNIILVSPSALEITGFEETYAIGKPLISFFADINRAEEFIAELKNNGQVALFSAEIITKNRGNIFAETNAKIVLNAKGEYNGIEGIFYDVSEQRKMEIELEKHRNNLEQLVKEKTEELETTNDELNATLRNLKETQVQMMQSEKMASLGILTAGVAHEINNPLNYIMGAYEGLKMNQEDLINGIQNDDVPMYLDALETGIHRAANIVKSLNQFSRTNQTLNEKCNIHEIIEDSLLMLQSQLKDRIEVRKEYTDESALILGNTGSMHQVILNILLNAEQAIVGDGLIVIKTEKHQEKFLIEILDSGTGIANENLSKITDPFFTTKDPGKGTGLGLSITYSIIREHGGLLAFESELDKGTTVKISLPLKKQNDTN